MSSLPVGLFSGVQKLIFLNLEGNEISKFQEKAFKDLISLEGLYLRNNNLKKIQNTIFGYLVELQALYLTNNSIADIYFTFKHCGAEIF